MKEKSRVKSLQSYEPMTCQLSVSARSHCANFSVSASAMALAGVLSDTER
jgi:hypothetical protein